jgi:hypothetical protein
MVEEYDDSEARELRAEDLKVGTIVSGLMFHTGVVVDGADTNEPTVEFWGYGHGIVKMPRRQIIAKDIRNDSPDSLHWFKVAVKGNVNNYGRDQLPQHEVTKAMYLKALDAAEAVC